MASEFSTTKCLWCVELPSKQCPRESPVFTVKGNECLFRFVLAQAQSGSGYIWYYDLHLELKSKHAVFKPCSGYLQVGFKKERILKLDAKEFTISEPGSKEIWYISKDTLKLPSDYLGGNWIKFIISFDDVAESDLSISKDIDDKSVQTPLYIDTNILLEGVSQDFSTLLDEGPYHDIEFICGDEAIKAHKNVLSCRSEVFASMLRTDMVERKTGQVKIQDVEGTIFKQFLRYLYTGVLPELTVDVALRFYEVSDKYAVNALKKQCTSFLSENLSPENACEVLIIADRHDESDFKKNVMEYMMKVKILRIREKWTGFCKENPSLANEVFNLLFQDFCLE